MSEVIHGACLCGAIAFDLHESSGSFAPPEWSATGRPAMGICHCTRCQRWSGGSGLPFVVAAPANLKVTQGHVLIARYREDGRGTIRNFCSQCGSSLYQDAGATYYVGAGVLPGLRLEPKFHINVAHKAPWDEIAGDAPQLPEMPTPQPRTAN